MAKDLIKKSKWLALILRHDPSKAKLILDAHGWAQVSDITDPGKGDITLKELEEIVRTDDKGRYEFNPDKTGIRAVQGHSIKEVEIEMEECIPPSILYHGTKEQFLSSIMKVGLKKMERQHVHLSSNLDTAKSVADRRKGLSVLLGIDSKEMSDSGYKFFRAKNGVWLVERVPFKYITIYE